MQKDFFEKYGAKVQYRVTDKGHNFEPTKEELKMMFEHLFKNMKNGAIGVNDYDPGWKYKGVMRRFSQ